MTMISLTPRGAREQQTFRALLNAMARPGVIGNVPLHDIGGDFAAALSVIESLVDHEVTFAVLPERADIIDAVLRQTGSRVAALEDAAYVLCESGSLAGVLDAAKDGTLEFPDRGATIVCRVESIAESAAGALVLSGPGIKDTATVRIEGFSPEAQALLADRNSHPPLGLDVVFVTADGRVTCINRNTKLKERE